MSSSDRELLNSIASGNEPAFVELMQRYRTRLLRFAARATGDLALSEDLVQEAFAAVHAAAPQYDSRFAVSTWIWTILLNLCRRHHRRQRSQKRTHLAWASRPPEVQDTTLDRLVRDEEAARLRRLLELLPASQADALRLRFFAELSFDEIAAAMNSSVSGAKVRVRKGLAALAQALRENEQDGPAGTAAARREEDLP
jgi:RNA polymerase sigma-70 factor, ECF subfamily